MSEMTDPSLHIAPVQVPFDEAELQAGIALANIPTLLMVLFQLTGDRRWLKEPYRPERTRGMADNDGGGLSEAVQQEIREHAVTALLAWGSGTEAAVPNPDADTVVEMLTASMGESVPPEFGPMSVEILSAGQASGPRRPAVDGIDEQFVVIIGAGISGMSAAVEFRAAGIPYLLVDKNTDVGGTWWENRYPGAGVDTPSYVYSFSSFPRRWSTFFGRRNEVEGYIQDFAAASGIRDDIRFGTEAESSEFDEATGRWTVTLRGPDGEREILSATAVVTAVGLLNRPKIPDIPGAESFAGRQCHSAQWPEDLDVTGLRVAVVGSGASAMQIVPAIADRVAHLSVLQRSPQWIAPSAVYFAPVPESVHWLMDRLPYYYGWYRLRLSWMTNDRLYPALLVDAEWPQPDLSINAMNDAHRRFFTRYIKEQLAGRDDLLAKSLPTYPPYGKRMLLDNGWYAALRRENVDLVTDGVAAIDQSGILTSTGDHIDVDVIVYATGFDAQKMIHPLRITGRGGVTLREVWGDDDAKAYLGMTVPGFPNLFVMYGPNVNLGHGGSYMYFGELQARYITDLLAATAARGAHTVEVRPEVHAAYNQKVDDAHARMIWSHRGMDTWYRNARGRVVTNSPWRVVDFWWMTREIDAADYVFDRETAG